MFQAFGWLEVLQGEAGAVPSRRVFDAVEGVIADTALQGEAEVVGRGGSVVVLVAAVRNRDRGGLAAVKDLMEQIAQVAGESIGLVHIQDDDAWKGFRVFQLSRGRVVELDDSALSFPAE